MRFLLLFLVTNTLVAATAAAAIGGKPLVAALLGPPALAALGLTVRVVVLTRPAKAAIPRAEIRRLVGAAKEDAR